MSATGRDLFLKRMPLSGILLGLILAYWLLEAIMDVLVFQRSSWGVALFAPDPNELWMRCIIAGLLAAFFTLGALAQARQERERRLSQRSLRDSAEHLMEAQARIEAVTAGTSVIMATVDKDLRYTFFSRGYADEIRRLTGKELHLGDSLGDLFTEMPDRHQAALQEWRTTLQGESSTKTVEFGDPAHHRRVFSVRHTPLRDGAGAIIGAGEVAWDITEREQSRREAEEVTRFSTDILESISDAFFSLDESMVVTSFNSEAERVLDRRREDVLGRRLFDVFPEARGSIFEERYAHALKTREPLHFEVHFEVPPLANWYEVRIYPNQNGISIFFQVITGRKEAEQILRKSEERLRRTETIAHLGSWDLDLTDGHLTWSDEVYRIFGLRPREFSATYEAFLERVPLADRQAVESAYADSIRENRDGYEIEHRVVRDDTGDIRVVHERCEHIRDAGGRIVRSVGMVHDITERKRSEEALRASEERYRTLVELSPVAVFVNRDDRIDFVNPEAIHLFGAKTAEELLGKSPFDLFHPAWHEQIRSGIRTLLEGGTIQLAEEQIVRMDGSVRDVNVVAALIRDARGPAVQAILQDITGRKEAEMALRKSEEKYRLLFENLSEGFALYELLYDEDGHPADWRVLEVNDAYERHTGISREQITGQRVSELFPDAIPEYLPKFSAVVATQAPIEWDTFAKPMGRHFHVVTFPAGTDRFASTLSDTTILRDAQSKVESLARFPLENPHPVIRITMEGTITYANPSSTALLAHWGCSPGAPVPEGVYRMMEEALHEGAPKEFEVACGGRFFSLTFTPPRNAEYINVYGRDITTKREAERRLEASLHEKEVLLREVHHRVKNNLQVISTLLDLQATAESDPRVLAAFRDSQARVKSIALVHGMLCRTENLSRVDLKTYLGDLVQNLASAHALPLGDVKLEFRLGDVEMDLERAVPCGLIINELVANAFEHAFPDGRRGTIRVELEREPDGRIRLSVADDGVGSPGVDESGEQTTLGLRLVGLLTRQLRGKIEEERAAGTRVTLRFPPNSETYPT